MKRWILLLCSLLLLSGCTPFWVETKKEEKELKFNENVEHIVLETTSTDIDVQSASVSALTVEMDTYEGGPTIQSKDEANRVKISLKKEGWNLPNIGPLAIGKRSGATVKIPDSYQGDLEIQVTSANVSLEKLNLRQLNLQSTSGDIQGDQLQVKKLSGKSSSGDVRLGFQTFQTDLNWSNTSGDVRLSLGEKAPDVQIELKSNSGGLEAMFPLQRTESNKKELKGVSGAGTHTLRIDTTSGDITLSQ
ncbi:DUF4097 domain-containing protein [Kroppenstedtia pulmonis]|uniref:DUF4097 domain-containing protein n=1 Tax=Kroppenstedtia pulmonis TaxID=1380685 RepID=A0A7D3Y9T1_9BACL|nr:DUF4097 family beta strand repeat-containing protein [Kroppenstedtia pulmonis]QKG84481.1 DUF4097 domain-containing protein [Kroppenstedtia pulmonis]